MKFAQKFFENRLLVLICVAVLMALILTVQAVKLQLVQGEYYKQVSADRTYKNITIKAPRGEIVDRYGRILAGNKSASSIVIDYNFESKEKLNDTIIALLEIVEQSGEHYEDSLPISYDEPYSFRFGEVRGLNLNEAEWKEKYEINKTFSPKQVLAFLEEKYEIKNIDDKKLKRKLIGVRYDMQLRNFSSANPFSFMTDIDITLVSKIKENSDRLGAVEIIIEPVRDYGENCIAAHLLGRVDKIYREEYEKLQYKGYGMNDTIGKDGLEKYLEEYLRGTDGREGRDVSMKGKTVTLSKNVEAVPGKKAVLSIDAKVQEAAEKTLAESVHAYYDEGVTQVGGGAAVAIDVNTGEVLALASYPTYNLGTFREDYSRLSNNSKNPMFNRAIAGAYPPGSTFKALTAITGLEEGAISGSTIITCNGPYQAYAPSYTPACWIHNDYGGSHDGIGVVSALEVSCNIYFYETGRRLGIEKLNEYAEKFGLGKKTGIELSGESEGILAGPKYRESIDAVWYPGDTIQAAIGQSDNMFTPIQMANYTATIANGGTRYVPHIVKNIVSYDGKHTIASFKPTVAEKIDISKENLELVHQGMRAVVETGSAKITFSDYEIDVAGKTGTAQSGGGRTPHSWFISFAPYDDPQIAIAVIIENAGVNGLGKYVYNVARNMYEAYFDSAETEEPEKYNSILN